MTQLQDMTGGKGHQQSLRFADCVTSHPLLFSSRLFFQFNGTYKSIKLISSHKSVPPFTGCHCTRYRYHNFKARRRQSARRFAISHLHKRKSLSDKNGKGNFISSRMSINKI